MNATHTPLEIEAGKYYRMRNGDVVGPLKRAKIFDEVQLWAGHYWFRWRNDGTFHKDDPPDMDLISEVYVSDTPPTLITVRTGSGGGGGGMTPDMPRVGFSPPDQRQTAEAPALGQALIAAADDVAAYKVKP